MIKRIFSVLLVLALVLSFSVSALANPAASRIVAGQDNSYIVSANGELAAVGRNDKSQLGKSDTLNRTLFSLIAEDVSDVSGGGGHTVILKSDNTLWAIGQNVAGQIGDGTTEDRDAFVKIMDDVKSVSAGYSHTFATTTDGTLFAWGSNTNKLFGNDAAAFVPSPTRIYNDVNAADAARYFNPVIKNDGTVVVLPETGMKIDIADVASAQSTREHILILTNQNELYAMGLNSSGQIGDGTTEDRDTPVKIMDGVRSISAGDSHSLAVKDDNTLWVWGSNKDGQIGNGSYDMQLTPVMIMDNVNLASAGSAHTLAVDFAGNVYAWGNNDFGQLGTGFTASANVPVIVDATADFLSEWAYPEVKAAEQLALTTPDVKGKYRNNITRQEFAGLAVKLYEKYNGEFESASNPFVDTNNADVIKAYTLGIVKGVSDTTFDPYASVTREQLSTMLYRAIGIIFPDKDLSVEEPVEFADSALIDDWAVEAVQFAFAQGILKGIGDNIIDPDGNSTREQAIALNLRIFNTIQ